MATARAVVSILTALANGITRGVLGIHGEVNVGNKHWFQDSTRHCRITGARGNSNEINNLSEDPRSPAS
jgi:hypothetical protein